MKSSRSLLIQGKGGGIVLGSTDKQNSDKRVRIFCARGRGHGAILPRHRVRWDGTGLCPCPLNRAIFMPLANENLTCQIYLLITDYWTGIESTEYNGKMKENSNRKLACEQGVEEFIE